MKKEITVTVNGKQMLAVTGFTLSEIIKGERPCGGHGRCGKCKVIARGELSPVTDTELKMLTADELRRGIRLACLTVALGDCFVESFGAEEGSRIVTEGELPDFELAPTFKKYGVAIDIGTTTLAARLYNTKGEALSEATAINPQQEWGADVISRIEAVLGGKSELLAISIREALCGLLAELAQKARIAEADIDGGVITGNTVMLSLLTGECVEPFSHAPFAASRLFGETLTAGELGLRSMRGDTPIYLPPCIAAFVGADTTCALIATGLCEGETAMLADIGTNGEMALWHKGRLTVCSTAAGPAFEGVGISMGMRGSFGAIDRISLDGARLSAHVIGETTPVGICGSGLVDAAACFLVTEQIDETGYMEDEELTVLSPVTLTDKDIRMLQLAKSAICAGLCTLMETAGVGGEDVSSLYIAGGFGKYLNMDSAVSIGLLPRGLAKRARTVGNAALAGAAMLLLSENERCRIEELRKSAAELELSTSPVFSELYMSGMMLCECE